MVVILKSDGKKSLLILPESRSRILTVPRSCLPTLIPAIIRIGEVKIERTILDLGCNTYYPTIAGSNSMFPLNLTFNKHNYLFSPCRSGWKVIWHRSWRYIWRNCLRRPHLLRNIRWIVRVKTCVKNV